MKKLAIVLLAAAIVGFAACKKEKKHTRKKGVKVQLEDYRIKIIDDVHKIPIKAQDEESFRVFRLVEEFRVRILPQSAFIVGAIGHDWAHTGETGRVIAKNDRGTYQIWLDDGRFLNAGEEEFERI